MLVVDSTKGVQSSAQQDSTDLDELGDKKGLVELDAVAQEVHQAVVIHLAEDPDFVQNLVNPFGVLKLYSLVSIESPDSMKEVASVSRQSHGWLW
ncbi:hypothetical protein PanWU01x14_052150 [Parasponia andersonii]|uniref:Uncharacterized protein n=1 Tax=Parasponia andersonii TaxID=3476 RepID=A0A2P5DM72_PARAD|nr:hypothetical protein PanWU01x14_052150 [Parasponia andersonii]